MSKRGVFYVLWLGVWVSCSGSVAPPDEDAVKQVEGVLHKQVSAWNAGDLSLFMETYWNSDELTFFSGANDLHGWQQTMARYQRRYGSDASGMGTLRFQDLKVELLGDASAYVRGRYRLERDGDHTGLFTLLLRRLPEGWKIVHDHSSTGQ